MKRKWPDVKVDDFSAAIDFIIKFYQELGWNLVQAIDPRKIKIHPEMWGDIADQLREKWGLSAALGWMNIGPSADEGNVVSGIIKWRDWGCGRFSGLDYAAIGLLCWASLHTSLTRQYYPGYLSIHRQEWFKENWKGE